MGSIPSVILEKIRQQINIPEGTVSFRYRSTELLNRFLTGGIIFEEISGKRIFRLERTNDFFLKFYYSSPGVETRVAFIDLRKFKFCDVFLITFTWSPKEINLFLGMMISGGESLSSKGEICDFELRTDHNSTYQIGDKNINIIGVSVFQDGKQVLSPTAINSWHDTKKALEILKTGKSDEGYIYESLLANMIILILVTGFESYTKKRILELEEGGIVIRTDNFFSDYQKKSEKFKIYQEESQKDNITLLKYMIDKRIINFQNFKECHHLFDKLINISFYHLGIDRDSLEKLKEFIIFRHHLIHSSILNNIVNESKLSTEAPIISDQKLATKAIDIFDLFINKLHNKTLEIR